MAKAAGFTLIELIAVMIVLAIIGIFAVPQMLDLRNDAGDAIAADYGAKVAAASKSNYSIGIARGSGVAVTTCTHAVDLLGTAPARFTFTDPGAAATASGQEKSCEVKDNLVPSGATKTFMITSCIGASCT